MLTVCGMAQTQEPPRFQRVEPGLETAVKWKWQVLPTEEKNWGVPMNEPMAELGGSGENSKVPPKPAFLIGAGEYEVVSGDALAKISKKAGITVDHLKRFNELTSDVIRVGQILKIPNLEEVLAMTPPPPVAKVVPEASVGKEKSSALPQIKTLADLIAEATLHQVFLDRENFSIGPIDGDRGTIYEKTLAIYQSIHPELQTLEALRQKAVAVVERPFASYRLKRSDLRFIVVGRKELNPPPATPSKSGKGLGNAAVAPPQPEPTYEELVAAEFSAYRTVWEFVAERFHCDETFLRSLNPTIKDSAAEGTEFKVPNVIPFEVENCFAAPLQPAADPEKPVTAMIVGLSRLEIRRGDQLIAVMPVSRARPALRGKGEWTILTATPGPRLVTRQEPTSSKESRDPGASLAAEQFLAAGPRNPVGICWINLAKAASTTPLPYGLHGTSIPSHMKTYESIGGFRLANWDIARAARLLPEGTPLQWK